MVELGDLQASAKRQAGMDQLELSRLDALTALVSTQPRSWATKHDYLRFDTLAMHSAWWHCHGSGWLQLSVLVTGIGDLSTLW
jgi:hypothetical protein